MKKPLWFIIKANAYGHGALQIVKWLKNHKACRGFGVSQVNEAAQINNCVDDKPILILGPCLPCERHEIIKHGWHATVSSVEEAKHYHKLSEQYGKKAFVHLFVDTGMGRAGIPFTDYFDADIKECMSYKGLEWKGIMSHFSQGHNERPTNHQKEIFSAIVQRYILHRKLDVHIHNSDSLVLGKTLEHVTSVRVGLALYGISTILKLYPVASLKSCVTLIKQVSKGQCVSYQSSYCCVKDMTIGIVGIGYADGWSRLFSNKGKYLMCNGYKCNILGNITMDQTIIDITKKNITVGDYVECFGNNISLIEQCQDVEIIPYECLTTCNNVRGGRIYIA